MFRIIGVLVVMLQLISCATANRGGVSDYKIDRKAGDIHFATVVLANGLVLTEINGERVSFGRQSKIINLPVGQVELKLIGNLAPGIEGGWEFTKPMTVALDVKEGETWLVHFDYSTSVLDRPKRYAFVSQNVDVSSIADTAKLAADRTNIVESKTASTFEFKMPFVDPMVPFFFPGEQRFIYAKSGMLYQHENKEKADPASVQVSSKRILFGRITLAGSLFVLDEDGTAFSVERDFSKSTVIGRISRPVGEVKSSNNNLLVQTSPDTISVYDESNLSKPTSQIRLSSNIQAWDVAQGAARVVVQSEGILHIFDTLGKEIPTTMPNLSVSEQLALSKLRSLTIAHDGSRVAFLDLNGNIWILEIGSPEFRLVKQDELLGKGATPVTHGAAISWAPDDNRILLYGSSYVFVYEVPSFSAPFVRTFTDPSGAEAIVEGDGGFSVRIELGGAISSDGKTILTRCKSLMGDNYLLLSADLSVRQ